MTTKRHLVLEIEDAELQATLLELRGRSTSVVARRVVEIAGSEGSALTIGLQAALEGIDTADVDVHVALYDRRFLHFALDLPKLPTSQLSGVVLREARRQGSLAPDAPLQVAVRRLHRGDRNLVRYSVVAAPESVATQLRQTLERCGLSMTSLTSIEEAASRLLGAVAREAVALLDRSASRLRLVVVDRGALVQRRRLATSPVHDVTHADADARAALLASEVARAFDYLRTQNHLTPKRLFLAPTLDLDEAGATQVAGPAEPVPILSCDWALPDDATAPGLATRGIVAGLRANDFVSVLEPIDATPSRGPQRRALAAAVAAVTLLLGGLGAVVVGSEANRAADERATLRDAVAALTRDVDARVAEAATVAATPSDDVPTQLREILSKRRVVSLLMANVADAVPEGVTVQELRTDAETGVVLRCTSVAESRASALHRVSAFRRKLAEAAYLADVREVVESTAGSAGVVRFEVAARWKGVAVR
jgi:Tfp pilus assembly protein PilN